MALYYDTDTFHDIRRDIDEVINNTGTISKQQRDEIVSSYEENPQEYVQEYQKYMTAREGGYGDEDSFRDPGEYLTDIAGTAIGEAAEGIIDVGEAILPEAVTKKIASVSDDVAEYIPEGVKRYWASSFDPYHGEGLSSDISEGIGTVASYLIAGGPAVKIAGNVIKGTMGAQKATGKLANALKWGVGGTIGATVVEDPSKENYVNVISDYIKNNSPDTYEEYKDTLETLAVDPNDPRALQYVNALFNNLAFEGVFGAALGAAGTVAKPVVNRFVDAVHKIGNSKTVIRSSTPISRLMNKVSRNLTSRFGTDDTMLEAVIKKDGASKAALTRASAFNEELEKVLKRDNLNNQPYLEDVVYGALNGDKDKLNLLAQSSEEGAKIVTEMRQAIDDLSTAVNNKMVKGGTKLSAKIDKNKGVYLNDAYELYDNPGYSLKNVPENIRVDAERYLKHDVGIPEEHIPQLLRNLTNGKTMGEREKIFKTFANMGVGTSKPFKKKSDIPEPIRKLWGVKKDPYENFSRTYEKLSNFKAQGEFAEEVRAHMLNKGIAKEGLDVPKRFKEDAQPEDYVEDLGEAYAKMRPGGMSDDFINPLEGLYADKNYADFIREGTDVKGMSQDPSALGALLRMWLKLKSASQYNATVLSSTTHGRNVIGNAAIMIANGMLPTAKNWTKQFKLTGNRLRKLNNKDLSETLAQLQELGVVDSSVKANTIRRVAQDAYNKDYSHFLNKATIKKTGKALDKAMNVYQAEDDFFKIIHFDKTMEYLKEAYPEISEDALKRMAAQRTRDMMPNYALVPKAIKRLRGAPVGDFMSFPAEMMRTSKNLVKYTLQDMTSGNQKLKNQAYKRLAGMSLVGTGGYGAIDYTANINDISEDQKQAINRIVPRWERDTAKVFMGPIKKDYRGNVYVDYYNMGPLDPYEYLKTAARTTMRLMQEDKPWDMERALDMGLEIGDKLLSPYLGSSMMTEAFMDAIKDTEGKEGTDYALSLATAFAKSGAETLMPGFINTLNNRRKFEIAKSKERGDPEYNLFGLRIGGSNIFAEPTGKEVGKWGNKLNPDSSNFGSFLGLKENTLDITAGMKFEIGDALKTIGRGTSPVFKTLSEYNVRDPNEVVKKYLEGQENKLEGYKKLRDKMLAYAELYPDLVTDIERALGQFSGGKKNKKEMQIIMDALQNIFRSDDLPIGGVRRALDGTGTPIPYDRIREIKEKLDFTEIE